MISSPASYEGNRGKDAKNSCDLRHGKDDRQTEILKGLRGLDVFVRPKLPPRILPPRMQCLEALHSWCCFKCKE